jgi:hypothetical protein
MLIGTLEIVRTAKQLYVTVVFSFYCTVKTSQQRTFMCKAALCTVSTGAVTITQVLYVDPVDTDFWTLLKTAIWEPRALSELL